SAVPPSPQEVTRKLSLHSVAKPNLKNSNISISGTESDSESLFSADQVSPPPAASASLAGGMSSAGSSAQPVLSAIAERRSASGEDSDDDDEDEDDGWPVAGEKTKPRDSADESVIKAGYLRKKGERRKTWKKRWFVLRPGHLAYYKSSAEYELHRLLDLNDVHACTPVALKRHPFAFGLVCPTRTYYLQAASHDELQAWVKTISDAREALNTVRQNTLTSAPIPIPGGSTRDASQPPLTPSPPGHSMHTHGFTSSESEDASSNAPRSFPASSPNRPISASPTKGQGLVVTDPTKPVTSGYLMKCGQKRHNWRKRWFVLTGEQLVYSGSHMDSKPHRQIPLIHILDALEIDLPRPRTGAGHVPPGGAASPQAAAAVNSEEGEPSQRENTFQIVTTKRTLVLCAPSEEEEIKWLSAVRALIARRSGAGVVPGAAGGSSSSKASGAASGSEIQHGQSASGSGSGSGG
ncbi:PH-domain-containing protein, partial [Neolentinus lepideus HHB14362 ss-1]